VEIDLHGMTVAEALDRAERALNDALLADESELRFIHGRSGGRKFRVDPRNEGVTVVVL
jgi:dsDNA-specific endonuclease/ATPase MutS2